MSARAVQRRSQTADAASPPRSRSDSVESFEFRLGEPPAAVLSADELFADGKLVPFYCTPPHRLQPPASASVASDSPSSGAPRSGIWRKLLLGLKKRPPPSPLASDAAAIKPRSMKRFLINEAPKSPYDPDPDWGSAASASSTSSSDSERSRALLRAVAVRGPRGVGGAEGEAAAPLRFRQQGGTTATTSVGRLARSSSSPGNFYGGGGVRGRAPRAKGMERSYSAHVRVDPVINVPVVNSSWLLGLGSPRRGRKETTRDGGGSCWATTFVGGCSGSKWKEGRVE